MTTLPKIFIFGAGAVGEHVLYLTRTQKRYQVIAFLDNDKSKWGHDFNGLPVCDPKFILETDYDKIIVASQAGVVSITEQLLGLGVSRNKICTEYVDFTVKSRIIFLEKLGELFREQNIRGSMAECGVFQGEFAREINRVFPNNKLYLFDTFCGFDGRDIVIEHKNRYSALGEGHFKITSEEMVTSKMLYPDMCITRKGYFPETTKDLEGETFCFVNLDFDLYQPTVAGLEYFVPRMTEGGVILIHDYFCEAFKGIKEAVANFDLKAKGLKLLPIGDGISVAIHF